MNILKQIFSIKNQNIHKIVTICGIKLKIKSNKLIIKNLELEIQNNDNYLKVQTNYKKVLKNLKEKIKSQKLNVIFLANEPQKWSYDSVYREFENSPYFEPKIIVIPRYRVHTGLDSTRMTLEEQYNFFKERHYNVEYGYKNNEYIDLKTFNPDIIFYLQLAEVPGIDDPIIVSEYALTAYCPYAYGISDYKREYLQCFHKLLFVYFNEHQINIDRFEGYKTGNSLNCVVTGHPKLDVYLKQNNIDVSKYWKNPDQFKIIYAPHHSFQKDSKFNFSTFPQNYKYILELAKKHPETTWLFKPHPMLKFSIIDEGLMSEDETNKYYQEWKEIGNYYDNGDYFDIFKSSDLMITDCASFLAEYLPSGHPLIRLRNPKSTRLNKLGEFITSEYYNAYSNEDLEQLFTEIVTKKNDYKKEDRLRLINQIFNQNQTSASKIKEYILSELNFSGKQKD